MKDEKNLHYSQKQQSSHFKFPAMHQPRPGFVAINWHKAGSKVRYSLRTRRHRAWKINHWILTLNFQQAESKENLLTGVTLTGKIYDKAPEEEDKLKNEDLYMRLKGN